MKTIKQKTRLWSLVAIATLARFLSQSIMCLLLDQRLMPEETALGCKLFAPNSFICAT